MINNKIKRVTKKKDYFFCLSKLRSTNFLITFFVFKKIIHKIKKIYV